MLIDKVHLPSNGLLGYNREVTVKEIGGLGLTAVYESLTDASIDLALREAVEGVDIEELCDEDKLFLLLKARTLTLGNIVTQPVVSPYTQTVQKQEVDLNSFDYTLLTQELLDTELVVKDREGKEYTFTRRVATKEIIESLLKTKERHLLADSYLGILRIISKLNPKVNGKVVSNIDLINLLAHELLGSELVKLLKFVDGLIFGLNLTYTAVCTETNQEFLGVFGLSADLFR